MTSGPELQPINQHLWISPLDVKFSQNVIYPKFSDGREVDEALKQIVVHDPSAAGSGEDESDAELILEPPFPRIEVVWWSTKFRDGEGRPLRDANGEEKRGDEALFSLDNRRLYALQRAAVARYPRRCKVSVSVIHSSVERAKHVKKFRTRTDGLSITVSEWNGVGRDNARDFSVLRVWDWRSVVARLDQAGICDAKGISDDAQRALIVEAAESGSCGSWEYLDNKDVCRGPFSNSMMREWWIRQMLPTDLRIRPYNAAATGTTAGIGDFRLVADVFWEAPAPFAPGWSPRTTDREVDWKTCAECERSRWEGWYARNSELWYCTQCWKRWSSRGT